MKSLKTRKPFFERLQAGLTEGIEHAKGELDLRTIVIAEPAPEIAAAELTSMRIKSEMSQDAFARLLNVSPKTVRSWERGTSKPSRAALRLIQVLKENPAGVYQVAGLTPNRTAVER